MKIKNKKPDPYFEFCPFENPGNIRSFNERNWIVPFPVGL